MDFSDHSSVSDTAAISLFIEESVKSENKSEQEKKILFILTTLLLFLGVINGSREVDNTFESGL